MSPPGGLDGNLFLVAIGAQHAVDRNFRRAAWTPSQPTSGWLLAVGAPDGRERFGDPG